jgi:uncharacterized glyoxalase superfamily protein PhnB
MSNQLPAGWPRVTTSLFYDDAAAAIDWLCKAFGFSVRLRVDGEDGVIVHSELEYLDGLIMVGSVSRGEHRRSPKSIGGANTQSIMLYVTDLDAHLARARAAGATILMEPKVSDYGDEYWIDRSYEVMDLEGHRFWFCERLKTKGA